MKPELGIIRKGHYSLDYDYIPLTATQEQVDSSTKFAVAYAAARGELYAKQRNQTDLRNIEDQVRTSKIFEFMVYNYIKDTVSGENKIAPPSVEIYTGKKRPQFDDDLTIKKEDGSCVNLHVKSQDIKRIHERAPLSWGFQVEDRIFSNKKNDILVLGIFVNDTKGQLVSKDYVHNFSEELADPKSDHLKGIKKFLYYKPEKKVFRLVA
jgi:hypothetical protein